MTLKEQISKDFMTAFKAKDMNKKNFLGVIKGEIDAMSGKGMEPTDENVLKVVKKMEKSLKETNNSESEKELSYIETYLPILMGEDRIREIISTYSKNGLNNIGQMMGEFNKNFKGMADNKVVSQIIKEYI
jgi:uncharacterized protein YqeY